MYNPNSATWSQPSQSIPLAAAPAKLAPEISVGDFIPNWLCVVIVSGSIGACGNTFEPYEDALPSNAATLIQDASDYDDEDEKLIIEGSNKEQGKTDEDDFKDDKDPPSDDQVADAINDWGNGVINVFIDELQW